MGRLKFTPIRCGGVARWWFVFFSVWLVPVAWAADTGETSRINEAIAQADAALAQQQIECRERFAVTPCVIDARRHHRGVVEPLRRELIVIGEVRRKQRAAERTDRVRIKSAAASEAALSVNAAQPPPAEREAKPPGAAPSTLLPQPGIHPTIRPNAPAADSGDAPSTAAARTPAAPPDADATTSPRRASKRLTPAPRSPAANGAADRESEAVQHRERVLRRNAEQDAKKRPAAPLPNAK